MEDNSMINLDLKRDLQEISTFIQGYVDTTYLHQIRNQIGMYRKECEREPCKEAELLRAIIPFIDADNQDKLENVVKLITYSKMIENMLSDYEPRYMLRGAGEVQNENYNKMHRLILVMFLYKSIMWAEESRQ